MAHHTKVRDDALKLKSLESNVESECDNDKRRQELVKHGDLLSSWVNSDNHKALPGQLKLGAVHLLFEALSMADSPHASNHMIEDTLALSTCGIQFITSHTEDKCTIERLETNKSRREKERRQLDAKLSKNYKQNTRW